MTDLSFVEANSIPEPNSGCWLWLGSSSPDGYGLVGKRQNNAPIYAHRVACEAVHGEIPCGMYACHHCDNPSCVNPDHLYIGTPSENISDAYRRKRRSRTNSGTFPEGETHRNAKLNVDAVRFIRKSHEGVASLGRRFGVSMSSISDVRAGRTWVHVDAS